MFGAQSSFVLFNQTGAAHFHDVSTMYYIIQNILSLNIYIYCIFVDYYVVYIVFIFLLMFSFANSSANLLGYTPSPSANPQAGRSKAGTAISGLGPGVAEGGLAMGGPCLTACV